MSDKQPESTVNPGEDPCQLDRKIPAKNIEIKSKKEAVVSPSPLTPANQVIRTEGPSSVSSDTSKSFAACSLFLEALPQNLNILLQSLLSCGITEMQFFEMKELTTIRAIVAYGSQDLLKLVEGIADNDLEKDTCYNFIIKVRVLSEYFVYEARKAAAEWNPAFKTAQIKDLVFTDCVKETNLICANVNADTLKKVGRDVTLAWSTEVENVIDAHLRDPHRIIVSTGDYSRSSRGSRQPRRAATSRAERGGSTSQRSAASRTVRGGSVDSRTSTRMHPLPHNNHSKGEETVQPGPATSDPDPLPIPNKETQQVSETTMRGSDDIHHEHKQGKPEDHVQKNATANAGRPGEATQDIINVR